MSIGALDAASAYGKVAGIGSALGKPSVGKTDGAGGFGSMVEDLVTGTAGQMRAAEHASAMQVAGKGDLIDVVTAIGAAETALDTMVAVRDRVVSAYTDIMRMQI
ncbi:flagellar hook-basal body complex protein FliE [Sphingomonas naasensis]|uniref:Flagellar hook-basal body complex protein FliE n=1 Tax=Sphingomonas naasensis TaxID=1344951 RepID=A0A4S1WML7_9SPHN|nr:flagellar hook-basal body complex protein FliE [Sphingomonas naasensis]NIJ20803.1 flagellar hook-basal body complex protein FliE [Sphingomonas naasensis]TGX43207.1 flagellar hook-basal body complex protein FliE [Sphingomonas naasensis]